MTPPRDQQSVEQIAISLALDLGYPRNSNGHELILHAIARVLTAHDEALPGEWRHADGMIFCGTLRIAKADFDTDPSDEFKQQVFDQLCSAANRNNSALRPLVDAQKNAICWLTSEHVSDNLHRLGALGAGDVRNALAVLRKALQPYSGQKEGANGN